MDNTHEIAAKVALLVKNEKPQKRRRVDHEWRPRCAVCSGEHKLIDCSQKGEVKAATAARFQLCLMCGHPTSATHHEIICRERFDNRCRHDICVLVKACHHFAMCPLDKQEPQPLGQMKDMTLSTSSKK
ncbi:unnamed protein product [Caenorhabditis angaria]|uniref:Uncharacterized protein n=1 Tax=Caenorhabditis angaria TaxID=860376 RepID=A0A9P1IKW2_9PELO|nr:unnamed protein product [Caenorhabditis angaria]